MSLHGFVDRCGNVGKSNLFIEKSCHSKSYKGAERLGHGKGYEYAHAGKDHFVAQDYLGVDKTYYEPTEQGVEKKIKERVEKWRAQFTEKRKSADGH